jgi:hypothetical protein
MQDCGNKNLLPNKPNALMQTMQTLVDRCPLDYI